MIRKRFKKTKITKKKIRKIRVKKDFERLDQKKRRKLYQINKKRLGRLDQKDQIRDKKKGLERLDYKKRLERLAKFRKKQKDRIRKILERIGKNRKNR